MIDTLDDALPIYLADLRALTSLDCGTLNKRGVNAAGAVVTQRCAAWGWDVETHLMADYGNCHSVVLRGTGQGRILLMGHLDTVYLDGVAASHPWREENGRIFAPGACDMKGGLLVGMAAMRALALSARDAFESLTFFFNSEEEMGSPVSRGIAARLARNSDAALVYEPARMTGDIVSARKASGEFTLRARGLAAHAGVAPEKGINAVVELSHRIIELQALSGFFPGVTVTPSVTRGGTVVNVVPDNASVTVDVRATNLAGMRAVEKALKDIAGHVTVTGAASELSGGFSFPPMEKTPAVALMADLAKAAAQSLGFAINDVPTGGASDASHLSQFAPTIDGMGPVGGNAHNADTEYIEAASILPRIALSVRLIQRLLAPDMLAQLRAHKGK